MRLHTSARFLAAAALIGTLSCEKAVGPNEPSGSELTVADLAQRLGGNDVVKVAVLTDRYKALDSLYAARFGVRGELPLSEAQVMGAIDAALGRSGQNADSLAATRASQDLHLTAEQVAANAPNIRELYRNLASYRVYSILSTASVQPSSTVTGQLDQLANNAAMLWLLVVNPDRRDPTLVATQQAIQFAKDYFAELRDPQDDDYFVPDQTRSNAYMHAMWNVLIVHYCGYLFETTADAVAWAKQYTDAHEGPGGTDGSAPSDMDQHNNAAGRILVGSVASRNYSNKFAHYEVATPSVSVLRDMVRTSAQAAYIVPPALQSSISSLSDNIFVFLKAPLWVKIAGTGHGSVESELGSINCSRSVTGKVTGTCVFDVASGQRVVLLHPPTAGSVFTAWSGDCSGPVCVLVMDGDKTVTARFDRVENYAIGTVSSPVNGGTTAGNGNYAAGAKVTLTAFPATGFAFTRWTENGLQVSRDNPLQFDAVSDRSIVALFTAKSASTYAIAASALPTVGGTVTGARAYNANDNVSLAANASPGFSFVDWTEGGNLVSTNNPYQFAATSNRNLVATFVASPQSYVLSVSGSGSGSGTVSSNSGEIGCSISNGVASGTCKLSSSGGTISLIAAPSSGQVFAGWSDDCSGTGSCQVLMTQSRSVTATFVATDVLAGISVSPDIATVKVGATTQMTAAGIGSQGNQLVLENVNWSSANAGVASVSQSGVVTGVTSGSTTIAAASGGKRGTAQVMVTAAATPTIQLGQTSLAFSAIGGASNPAPGAIAITNSGTGTLSAMSASAAYQSGQPTGWLGVSLSSTVAPATLTLSPTITSLPAGTYSAMVVVASSAPAVTNSPRTIAVTLTVSAAASAPSIVLGAANVSFVALASGSNPAGHSVSVSNGGTGTLTGLTTSTTYQSGQPTGWLSAALSAMAAPTTINLGANISGLAAGAYSATVIVASTASGVTNTPRSVAVSLTLSAPAVTAPATPLSLSGTPGPSFVSLAWADNSSNEDGFYVDRAPAGTTNFSRVGSTGRNVAAYSDVSVSPGASYAYRVSAFSAGGTSGYSNIVTVAIASAITTPAAPANLIGLAAAGFTVSLTWADFANNEDGFRVERAPGGTSNYSVIASPGANSQAYFDTGLNAATSYKYRVRAYNVAGTSGPSNVVTVTTNPPVTIPGVPTLLSPGTANSPGPSISTLTPAMTWTAVAGATGYGVYVADVGSGALVYDNDAVRNTTSISLPSGILKSGHSYRWNMRARNSAGFGDYTARFYFRVQ